MMPDEGRAQRAPRPRLDWQRFSRFFIVGDLRRPEAPSLGLMPATARAKSPALWTPVRVRWPFRVWVFFQM